APPRSAVGGNLPPMLCDHPVSEAEPKPGSMLLGGEEGVEDSSPVLLWDTGSIVVEGNLDHAIILFRLHHELALSAVTHHGLIGIEGDVDEGLLELVGIHHRFGERLVKLPLHDDGAEIDLIGQCTQRFLTELIDVGRGLLRRLLPYEVEEALNDLLRAEGRGAD